MTLMITRLTVSLYLSLMAGFFLEFLISFIFFLIHIKIIANNGYIKENRRLTKPKTQIKGRSIPLVSQAFSKNRFGPIVS